MRRKNFTLFAISACLLLSLQHSWASTMSEEGAITQTLPQLGDGVALSIPAERQLGDGIAKDIIASNQFIEDPVISTYVDDVMDRLIKASTALGNITPEMKQTFAWKILLINDKSVNAFALPGGYFGLNLGLLMVSDDSAEVASVLAHELSHVTQRHIARMMAQQKTITSLMIGSIVAGLLAASNNPQAASALIVGGQALGAQSQLNFSRSMEQEADRIGFQVLVKSGYDPFGFVEMFKKLQAASKLMDSNDFPYLRDHPLTTTRIADMQNRLGMMSLSKKDEQRKPLPSIVFAMIHARAIVLAERSSDASIWENRIKDSHFKKESINHQLGTLYGAAFSAERARKDDQALTIVKRLEAEPALAKDARALALAQLLKGSILLSSGDAKGAVQTLSNPDIKSRPGVLLWAKSADATRDAKLLSAAAQRLQMWTLEHPDDTQAWQILGRIYEHQGRVLDSMRAQAEESIAHLNFQNGLQRLEAAQRWAKDHEADKPKPDPMIVDIIKSRLQTIKEKIKRIKKSSS